jgi:lysophospholipase L1-like esterase
MKFLLASLLALNAAVFAQTLPTPTIETNGDDAVVIKAPAGAKVLYTIDGSAPNAQSGPYIDPVVMQLGGKVRAISVSEDHKVMSKAVEIDLPLIPTFARVPESTIPCTQGRDFPTYDFAKRHAAVIALAKQRKPKLVFIGDSITHMWGGEPADRPQAGKEVWEKYYAPRNAGNLGFGFDFTENTLWRVQHGELDPAEAKVVVLNIGTNNTGRDSAQDIAQGVHMVVMEIQRKKPAAKVLVLGIYPRGARPDATRDKIKQANAQLATMLKGAEGVTFLDIGDKLVQPDGSIGKDVMEDGLHPTAKGYGIIAEAIEPTIKKLMGE